MRRPKHHAAFLSDRRYRDDGLWAISEDEIGFFRNCGVLISRQETFGVNYYVPFWAHTAVDQFRRAQFPIRPLQRLLRRAARDEATCQALILALEGNVLQRLVSDQEGVK